MIDNFNIIKNLLEAVENGDTFYHLQVIRRGKDHPGLPAANKTIQTWLVRGREHLDKLRDDIVFLCEHYGARAYINLAPKSMARLDTAMLCLMAEKIHARQTFNPYQLTASAVGSLKSVLPLWVVDIDSDNVEGMDAIVSTIANIWRKTYLRCISETDAIREFLIAVIPTKSGHHLITRPFNLKEFSDAFPGVDVHKNNPTILYIPDSI